ncbi:MAG: hypothetical protein ACLP72_09070 [Candidatus Sulfotelmatobacter sp.]
MTRSIRHDEDEIDRILFREDEILPSSGFAASVMNAVRQEAAAAAAPPPIPFPWIRALPGLVVAGLTLILVLVAGVVEIAQLARASTSTAAQYSLALPSVLSSALNRGVESAALWAVLALLATWASVKLSMLLASDRM